MRKSIIMVVVLCYSVAGYALDVAVEAGGLQPAVGAATDAEELIIKGRIDERDFIFIEKNMPSLKQLDLSEAVFDAIPDAVFAGSKLEKVNLPTGCKIGKMAFSGSALTTIVLPVECQPGDGAFAACYHLKKIKVAGKIKLGNHVFFGNDMLTSVEGSQYITVIGDRVFEGCTSFEQFDFSPSLTYIGYRSFANSGIKEVDMSNCSMLDSTGGWVFANCHALQSASLPPQHGEGIFFGCSALQKMEVSADRISNYALANTISVEKMIFPELSYIGNSSMEGMKKLSEIDARALKSVPALGSDVWARSNVGEVRLRVVPGLADTFASTPQWSDFIISAEQTSVPLLSKENGIKVWFAGNDLMAESDDSDLYLIYVTDIKGRSRLCRSLSAQRAVVDVSLLANDVYIIEITLADGSRHVAKLRKNG